MFRYFLYVFLIFPVVIYSQSYNGRIVRIIDGDSLLFQTNDSTFYTVHLYGIIAPEKDHYFGAKTIDRLERYLWADAKIEVKRDLNQDGISVILYIRGTNINKDLVRNGYAWYNRPQCINAELARSEEYAREKKLGLWKNRNTVLPWDLKKGRLAKPPPTDGKNSVLICADSEDNHYHKKYCKELLQCHYNVIVILKKQAKDIHMKPCKYCF